MRMERTRLHDEFPFKVVRSNGHDEIIACAANLLIGRAAYEEAVRKYPDENILYKQGARVIAESKRANRAI